MRLAQEVPGRKGLQRQAKCFLAAMNALRLVNENYAWIVKPVTTDNMVNILFIKKCRMQVRRGISVCIFPDRDNTGNFSKTLKIYLTQGIYHPTQVNFEVLKIKYVTGL